MNRWLKRIAFSLVGLVGLLLLIIGVAALFAPILYPRTWNLPLPSTRAVKDSLVIARGRYLVYGPGRCGDCHAPDSVRPRMFRGEEVPLTGCQGDMTYLGVWRPSNLTMDSATGIGMVSDGQLAREIRNGVNREGHISLPFMSTYTDMAEADLIAIISFLRTLPPAPGFAPGNQTNILGKIVMTYFLKPYAPKAPPPESLPPEPSVRYGEYLGVTLGGCRACHTERSMHTGRYLSPPFTGGLPFRSKLSPGYQYFSSNLTPDSATSSLGAWSEEDFIKRFRKGLTIPEAPMPWGSYMRMTDTDLRAMYRYFRSLKPVYHDCGKPSTLYPIHGRVAKAHGSANDPSEK